MKMVKIMADMIQNIGTVQYRYETITKINRISSTYIWNVTWQLLQETPFKVSNRELQVRTKVYCRKYQQWLGQTEKVRGQKQNIFRLGGTKAHPHIFITFVNYNMFAKFWGYCPHNTLPWPCHCILQWLCLLQCRSLSSLIFLVVALD